MKGRWSGPSGSSSWKDQLESLKLELEGHRSVEELAVGEECSQRDRGRQCGKHGTCLGRNIVGAIKTGSAVSRSDKFPEGMVLSASLCSSVLSKNVLLPSSHWMILANVILEGTGARKGFPAIFLVEVFSSSVL